MQRFKNGWGELDEAKLEYVKENFIWLKGIENSFLTRLLFKPKVRNLLFEFHIGLFDFLLACGFALKYIKVAK